MLPEKGPGASATSPCSQLPFTDAHLHLISVPPELRADLPATMLCSTALTPHEWELLCALKDEAAPDVTMVKAFGVHPQNPELELLEFLEKIIKLDKRHAPDAIGEAGYDFFTPEFCAREKEQAEVWYPQVELAAAYGKPLVVHVRRGLDRLFRDVPLLKKVPSVIFHSFPGSPTEAAALLGRGVNAFFSFGKPIMNGRKNSIACVRGLDADRLLFETDAPYQTLKGEEATPPADISRVYAAAAEIRDVPVTQLAETVRQNFIRAFMVQ